jgi:hypothetical protein
MKKNKIILTGVLSITSAIIVVIIFKYFEYNDSAVYYGGAAGGIAGAICQIFFKKK